MKRHLEIFLVSIFVAANAKAYEVLTHQEMTRVAYQLSRATEAMEKMGIDAQTTFPFSRPDPNFPVSIFVQSLHWFAMVRQRRTRCFPSPGSSTTSSTPPTTIGGYSCRPCRSFQARRTGRWRIQGHEAPSFSRSIPSGMPARHSSRRSRGRRKPIAMSNSGRRSARWARSSTISRTWHSRST